MPIRKLSNAEMQEKREKGLCFSCDQKWFRNHKCPSKLLMLIGVDEEDEEGVKPEPVLGDKGMKIVITGDISNLNTLAGHGNPRSLRLWGEVERHPCLILIDSGSTHNFIQPAMAEKLNLSIRPTTPFHVYIGNGDTLLSQFICPNVKLCIQGTCFILDLYVLPIKGPDVVMGVQWL